MLFWLRGKPSIKNFFLSLCCIACLQYGQAIRRGTRRERGLSAPKTHDTLSRRPTVISTGTILPSLMYVLIRSATVEPVALRGEAGEGLGC